VGPEVALSRERLRTLRWITIAAELGLILLADRFLGTPVQTLPALCLCAGQAALNLVSLWWPRGSPRVGARELLAQLLVDVAWLTAISYFAGGSVNPLISLYLPLIAVGATVLPPLYAGFLAAICVACYTAVSLVHQDLPMGDHEQAFHAHLFGMWLVFVCSAVVIAWFVVRLSLAIRRRDAALAAGREDALRNERIVALGNLAAGAAHELGTPLATLAVVAGELVRHPGLPAEVRTDAELMRAQVLECKRIVTQLLDRAGSPRSEAARVAPIESWIEALVARWRLHRPGVVGSIDLRGPRPGPRIVVDETLDQALLNLFNNAADADPGTIEIGVDWTGSELQVAILDRGPGIAETVAARIGREPVTTRGEGRGIGAVLAQTAIRRLGGDVSFGAREDGGAAVRLGLPLARLLAKPDG
jgi:two-component system sensor histidine kinase RegB